MFRIIRGVGLLFAVMFLANCGVAPEKRALATDFEVAELRAQIMTLGPNVDPEEAGRAAKIAFSYTRELAIAYEITDPPLLHNTKVNMGLRPRGLCWHWAEDMEDRLDAEGFKTLEMHRAIANSENRFRIDHSTAIISAMGDTYRDGIVLDPWRLGGVLTHVRTMEDPDYEWDEQQAVLARKRREILAAQGRAVPG